AAPIFGAACDCLRLARLGEWRGRDPSAKTYDGRIARPSARSLAPTRRWRCCSRRRRTLGAGLWTIFAGCMISGVGALVTAWRGRCGGSNMRVLFETGLVTSNLVVTTLDVAYELGKISQDSALPDQHSVRPSGFAPCKGAASDRPMSIRPWRSSARK